MIIETDHLTKFYGSKAGCEEICLSVSEGQIFGFLGPNGAGKSTVIKMLVGLIHPSSGSAKILGLPLGNLEARRRIGFLPENFKYQEFLTGEELLNFHASLCRMPSADRLRRVPEVLKLVKLEGSGNMRIKAYSKGMQQRLGIACALLANPDLLFLDEPTSALDPIGRREVREILINLKQQGRTVFLNSHLLSEVELICDEVAIINKGQIITSGILSELLSQGIEVDLRVGGFTEEIRKELEKAGKIVFAEESRIRVTVAGMEDVPKLAENLVKKGGRLYELTIRQRSLEDLFVELVQGDDDS